MEQEATETTEVIFFVSSVFSVSKGLIMHPLFTQASGMTHDVIGAAIEVHKDKGPGLLESIYEWCLTMELQLRGRQVKNTGQGHHSVQAISTRGATPLRFADRQMFVCRSQSNRRSPSDP
jgi:hypothetical protein